MRPLALLLTLALPAAAFAHRLDLTMTPTPAGPLTVVAGYDDDTPSEGATIRLLSGDTVISEGKTDERGMVTLPRPNPGPYKLTADDGAGHKATLDIYLPPAEGDPSLARAETDKPNRWLRMAVGLGIIGGIAVVGRRAARRRA